MASIRVLAPGVHQIRLRIRDAGTGNYRERSFVFRGSKREAMARAAELEAAKRRGGVSVDGRMPLGDWLRRWLASPSVTSLGPRTRREYEMVVERHMIPDLGHLRLDRLHPVDIDRYSTAKLTDHHPNTVHKHLLILHNALGNAVKKGLLDRNPCDLADRPRKLRRTPLT